MSVALSIALDILKCSMQSDPDYLWTWQSNIAMPIKDSTGVTHEQANRAAASILSHLFNVDVTKLEQWGEFERAWKNTRNRENAMRGTSKEDAEAMMAGYGTATANKPQYEERKATIDFLQKNVGQFAFDRHTASEAMQQAIHWLLEQAR